MNTVADTQDSQPNRSVMTDALIIAFFSATAYLYAYEYESGFAWVFNIPKELVTISMNSILLIFTTMFSVILAVIMIRYLLHQIFGRSKNPFFDTIYGGFTPLIVLLIAAIMLHGFRWYAWISYLSVLAIFLLYQFALPLITERDIKGYKGKFMASEEKTRVEIQQNVFIDRAFKTVGRSGAIMIVWFFVGWSLSWSAGKSKAYNDVEYLVTKDAKQVILRIYGDVVVAAPFDRESKGVGKEFSIFKLGDTNKLELKYEKVGPLVVK